MFTKLKIYSDGFLIYCLSFILSYAVFIYKRLGVVKSLTLSLITGFITATALFAVKYFFNHKNDKTITRKNLILNLSLELAFYSREELLNLFKTLLEKQKLIVVKHREFLEITQLNAAFYPIFKYENLTIEDLINAYKKSKCEKIFIAAKSYCEECFQLYTLKPETFTLFDLNDVFLSLEQYGLLPEIKAPAKEKRTIKSFAITLFKQENFKKFLLSGLLIISLSTISSMPMMFILSGCAISLTAVAIKLFAQKSPKSDKGIFLNPSITNRD